MKLLFTLILTLTSNNNYALADVSKYCGDFSLNLEGTEEQKELGKSLYRELYEELEELSLETKKIDICSFSCSPHENAVQCDLHLKLEYSYIPFIGEYYGIVYCEETYLFDGQSDYKVIQEECDLSEFPVRTR